jgi:hypothetical protein
MIPGHKILALHSIVGQDNETRILLTAGTTNLPTPANTHRYAHKSYPYIVIFDFVSIKGRA